MSYADRLWIKATDDLPKQDQIVIVHGGIAQYRSGVFYTGMEDPRYQRPIQWLVTHWMPLPTPPSA